MQKNAEERLTNAGLRFLCELLQRCVYPSET